MSKNLWDILGYIGSVCSIIGLPIAIWQIRDLKSKVEASKIAMQSILDMREHEKIKAIFEKIADQYKEISDIQTQFSKPGVSGTEIRDRLETSVNELSICIVDLPDGNSEIADGIKCAKDHITVFLQKGLTDKHSLREAAQFLYSVEEQLKKKEKRYLDQEIEMASKQ